LSKEANLVVKLSSIDFTSVAEPHHLYAALATGKIFDAAPAALAASAALVASAASASTLLHSKAKFLKRTKV
jgi:hypothetical protein